ncbi:hypothetical protein [Streptomyces sp. NPDC052496]|uniref:LppU/SCO3897 family protein n=1 Tax=Streptomyces sp. NPDC052496 TaxID=3154951 RepID=UPI003439EC2A
MYGQQPVYGQQPMPGPQPAPGQQFPNGQQPPNGQPGWLPPTPPPGTPMFTPTGPPRRPWLRPLIAVGILAVAAAGFWGLTALTDDGKPPSEVAGKAKIGQCLENRGTHDDPVLFTIGCEQDKADYKLEVNPGPNGKCPPELDEYTERGRHVGYVKLCLSRLHD